MNYHDLLLQQLSKEEQKDFEILAYHLIFLGWESQLSFAAFAQLLNDHTSLEVDNNYAERKLKKFAKVGLIEIKKNETSTNGERGKRLANTIILKSFAYKGILLTGVVPLDSILYIKRKADELCHYELTSVRERNQSVPFIRLKGAKGIGKSSLLERIGNFLEKERKEKVVRIDLGTDAFNSSTFTDIEKLFYSFTKEVKEAFAKLIPGFEPRDLEDLGVWDKNKAPGKNCTDYLEEHVFQKIDKTPKTLLIDGIDLILGKPTQDDFLLVLRTWSETKMKLTVNNTKVIWPSIVIAYSTEPYPDAKFQGSPLQNVGTSIELDEFTPESILNLTKLYGLTWNSEDVKGLIQFVESRPSLIQIALYQISQANISLEQLEEEAVKIAGPFSDYLLKYLKILKAPGNEELKDCFQNILQGKDSDDVFSKYQLEKIGLIRSGKNKEEVSCELYRRFFEKNLDF